MANTHSLDLESGSSQYAYISDASQTALDLQSLTGGFTIELWIKPESFPAGSGTVILVGKTDPSASKRQYYMTLFNTGADPNTNNIQVSIVVSGNGINTFVVSANCFSENNDVGDWVHLVTVFDLSNNSNTKIYKNGVLQTNDSASGTTTSSVYNSDVDFAIGARKSSGNWGLFFDGLIDDVRIWSDIRTQQEIQDNMSVELVGNEANLIGYWKFNNSALDETSNNNDLTLVNSPTYSTDVPFSEGSPSVSPSSSVSPSTSPSASQSPSSSESPSVSPSSSTSPSVSPSASVSPSSSVSPSISPSASVSPSSSESPSVSPSASTSPSASVSPSVSPSSSQSPSSSESPSVSPSSSVSPSVSPSASISPSSSVSPSVSPSSSISPSDSSVIQGTTTWGHVTGVLEVNTRTLVDNWTGTATITGTGDSEKLVFEAGQVMTGEVVEISGTVEVLQNTYNSGDDVLLEYRHGTTEANCLSASWNTYTVPFESDGFVQIRATSTL